MLERHCPTCAHARYNFSDARRSSDVALAACGRSTSDPVANQPITGGSLSITTVSPTWWWRAAARST